MSARREAIKAALLAAGCTCPGFPTWTWVSNIAVRCRCGTSVAFDNGAPTCPYCGQDLPSAHSGSTPGGER